MVSRAVNVVVRVIRSVSVVTFLFFTCTSSDRPVCAQSAESSTPVGQPATPAAATSASPAAAAPAVTPAPPGSPTAGPNAEATASAKRAAEAACKKSVAAIGSGDLSALKSLAPEKRAAIEKDRGVWELVSCLAAADGNSRACGALPKAQEEECVKNLELLQSLKAPPKSGAPPAPLVAAMHKNCLEKFSRADCDKMQEAWTSKDASKCKGLPSELSDGCAAAATGDPSRCPKESQSDCLSMIKVQKEGLKAMPSKDPIARAFLNGKREACGSLLAGLEERCSDEKKTGENPPQKQGETAPAPAKKKEPPRAGPGGN